jgi:cysteine desulfurase
MSDVIYLDNHATTPCDPRVVEAMLPYFSEHFGNPSSVLHSAGRRAARAVEEAREQIAALIQATAGHIIFTSGATEANNLVLRGLTQADPSGRRRVVTTPIEHKSVLEPIRLLAERGYEIVTLPVSETGVASVDAARYLINEETLLVSVQAANNEIGTIQPIAEIARIARENGVLVHCDAAQAVGKIAIDVEAWGVDFLSMSSHKLYGPKGIGALCIASRHTRPRLVPLLLGGGQENGMRAGTINVPGVVGFGRACQICQEEANAEAVRVAHLRDRLEARLVARIPTLRINGDRHHRLPGTSNLTFPGVEADALILNLPRLALSTGSACNSGAPEPSYVLTALGLRREDAVCSLRIGLGRFTTDAEIDQAVSLIADAAIRLSQR